MISILNRIKNYDSHHRLFIAITTAGIAAIAAQGHVRFPVQLVAAWNVFAVTVLALAWVRIVTARPGESVRTAKLQDSNRNLIFLFVILAACASLVAIGYVLGSAGGRHGGRLLESVGLAFGTLIGSWSLIHTVFALHYAHIYYGDAPDGRSHAGGLKFPGEPTPDYMDFAYFSFVVGMTCQVSDVQVTGRRMRSLTLLHGLLSFAFNTVILALSINMLSGLFAV